MAEWLRRGLQILARRFDSGSGLQIFRSRQFLMDRSKGARAADALLALSDVQDQNWKLSDARSEWKR